MGWLDIFDKTKRKKRIISVAKKEGNFGLMLINYNIMEKIEFCLMLIKAGSTEIPYDELDKERI